MKRPLLGLIPLLLVSHAPPLAGQWDTLWTRTYGGDQSDRAYAVRQLQDGGFVIVGLTESMGAGSADCVAIRTDEGGRDLWERTFGGSKHESCYAVDIVPTGGFVLAGETESFAVGNYDVWLLRLSDVGDTLWTTTFGGPGRDWAEGVLALADGGFLAAGGTTLPGARGTDGWLIRTDSLGNQIWSRTLGGEGHEWAEDIIPTADGHFLVPGWAIPPGSRNSDAWLVKVDGDGNIIWQRTYDRGGGDVAKSVTELAGIGYLMAGVTDFATMESGDFWLLLTDTAGDTIWTKAVGGDQQDWAFSVVSTTNTSAVAVGRTYSQGAGDADLWFVTIDARGAVLGSDVLGGPRYELATYVTRTLDGGMAVAGFTESFGAGNHDIWLLRLVPREQE